ncbi:helix-turn-helix transcriptional regulator [Iamia sp. SCSIO 61187]|uniref:winged helix-turn-helix transcriptional regulator n=1 Tax=Iamia sp. SCSIO 61187 TaxID=2722752 RepID=UPI001C629AD9|nr:helix-turn-helix domain-containing protein [Iamia sp. SCSIO 61187]QYG93976.1 helix-turn-helix transcriptional regulator [Iamia sp. SCSIO 61187]
MTSYGQFCPVAKAADVLGPRWAVLVVREMLCGSRRFGEIQRGVPGCPPATLSKRLKELVVAGVAVRHDGPDGVTYDLTEAGLELYPIVEGLGRWAQRWARSTYGPDELDADLLLWDVRRFLAADGLGVDRAVVELRVRSARRVQRYWITVDPGAVDLCLVEPQRTVDLLVEADLRALTQVWMGDITFAAAVGDRRVVVSGAPALARRFPGWFGRHPVLAAEPG